MRIEHLFAGGVRQVRDHPQLVYTAVLAAAIVASFSYVAISFSGIAKDAQDQLVNVRIGSLQDAFAPLSAEVWDKPDVLRTYMRHLQELNPTIVDFDIVAQSPAAATAQWVVIFSSDPKREEQIVFRQDLLLNLAKSDPSHSFTIETSEGGVRYFYTARAVIGRDGAFRGIALTKQTLSAADQEIGTSLDHATITLVIIVLFLMLLFFRHARIIDYAVLYRKLREVDTLKDDFISMASHELRAPLTAIRGYAEMLGDQSLDTAARTQAIQRIDLSAKELDSLVADMLDVSRIEQGRMKIEPVRLDTKQALTEVCDTWEMRAKQKELTLTRELQENLAIMVDPDRFRQIAINLISNAVKYTNKGGITVRTYTENHEFVLRVSDTGIGMTEDERQKLFAKFYRAAGADVRKEQGTGLGLWITKELIEKMGGRVSVESIKGVGSHFIVRFTLAEAA